MSSSYFKDIKRLGESSNFTAWKIRLEVALDENDVLEYVEGKFLEPLKNAPTTAKVVYKKGELKTKKIIIDSLKDHFLTYIGKLKKYKAVYGKMVGTYEVNNLNHILSLKNQLKDINMNKGETMQSYIVRISQLRD